MAQNLFVAAWNSLDQGELRFILKERIGEPGQYFNREQNPYTFYLPLYGNACKIKLTFSDRRRIVAIEPGPAFDANEWGTVAKDIERNGPVKIGRDISFSGFRVSGSWKGRRSGVQILPPPPDAPVAPVEIAEHPFVLEFPFIESDCWQINNFRRGAEHQRLTRLLNILLVGRVTSQTRRSRDLWASVHREDGKAGEIKWVQEFFFANFGEIVSDQLSATGATPMTEVDPKAYYTQVGHDGRHLQVPSDLDDAICSYTQLSPENREKFNRAAFWMNMASRQWTLSLSAVFASLAIAVETLGDKNEKPTKRFRDFIEKYVPGASLEQRRNEMYALRSEILHGDAVFQMDLDADFGWSPAEQIDKDLLEELWGLTRMAIRNWLRNP
jgi:hypothetical protein